MIIFSDKYKLRQGDFDHNDNIKASAVLDLFQTVASIHAEQGGMGFEPMINRGIVWVVTKIKFDCYAKLYANQTVIVETIPQPKGLVDYTRDYYIYNENGDLLIKGTSQWVLIDYNTRRIVRPTMDFEGEFSTRKAYDEKKIEKISETRENFCYEYKVRNIDLDHNGHLNNIRYADIIYNCETSTAPINRLIINFNNEARLGDIVTVYSNNANCYCAFIGDKSCFTAYITRKDF